MCPHVHVCDRVMCGCVEVLMFCCFCFYFSSVCACLHVCKMCVYVFECNSVFLHICMYFCMYVCICVSLYV